MAILPYLLEKLAQPTMYDQNFGLGFFDDDLILQPGLAEINRCPVLRPWHLNRASTNGLSHIQNDENNFKVNLDVQQFKPNEVSVKVADGYIVVDGKHEERSDQHGFISRQFTRRYQVPDNVDPNMITSTLSSDGILSIGAPKKAIENAKKERPIQIVQCNEPSIKGPQNKGNENGQQKDIQ